MIGCPNNFIKTPMNSKSLLWTVAIYCPSPSLDGRTRNFQSIAFLCGPLFVYVIAARLDNFDVVSAFNSGHLVRIWPIHNRTVHWPLAHVLSPTEMDRFAMALDEMKSLPNVRYGGDLPKQ